MQKSLPFIVILLTFLAGGCAQKSPEEIEHDLRISFTPTRHDAKEPVAVHVVCAQTEPRIFHADATYFSGVEVFMTGGAAGFFNVITALTSTSDASAQQGAAPLYSKGLGDGFTNKSRPAIEQAVRSSSWLKVRGFDPAPTTDFGAENQKASILGITISHGLSADGMMFAVEADVSYYCRDGVGNPDGYNVALVYLSAPINAATSRGAIGMWAENNGARYRQAADEGIAEMCRMLGDRFLNRSPNPPPREDDVAPTMLKIQDPFSTVPSTDPYYVIRRDGQRVVAKNRYGTVYSLIPLPTEK